MRSEREAALSEAAHVPVTLAEVARKATLADVAQKAGVSINTVSRALRAPQTVRPLLRQRIEAVMDELDYVPNRLAGGLAGAHAGVVGVIVTSLFFSEFAAVVDTMQADLAAAGLSVMLGNSRYDPDEELRLVRAMLSWRPAAMVLVGVDHHPQATRLLRAAGVPVVEIWDWAAAPIDTVAGMDHALIGRRQALHLIDRGYRRIAFVGAIREHDHRARKRLEGYALAIQERLGQEPVLASEPTAGHPDRGERLTLGLMQQHPDIDAVICNGDIMAFGALRALRRLGRRVPEEVGVIGFGNAEVGTCTQPTLTSVRPPRPEIGHAAASIIMARVQGGAAASRSFEAEIVARESTARRQ
jgi:LacI family gluconate utilization system Gnt-I transcriptional repressor